MLPEVRILALAAELPGEPVALGGFFGCSEAELSAATGIAALYHSADGDGPSALAERAARRALEAAGVAPADVAMVIFATATPDVNFPGAACFLQDRLGLGTVPGLDVRAQSAGFLCGLELATAFCGNSGPLQARPTLLAAGEVLSSGLDLTPAGREMASRLGDGAAVALVGPGTAGLAVRALEWATDGELAESFWCEAPGSQRMAGRVQASDFETGRIYPQADVAALAPVARERLADALARVRASVGWRADQVDLAIVDWIDPEVAQEAAAAAGLDGDGQVVVPTRRFGNVFAGGLPIALAQEMPRLGAGARILLAAAGPGFSWGAAALEQGARA